MTILKKNVSIPSKQKGDGIFMFGKSKKSMEMAIMLDEISKIKIDVNAPLANEILSQNINTWDLKFLINLSKKCDRYLSYSGYKAKERDIKILKRRLNDRIVLCTKVQKLKNDYNFLLTVDDKNIADVKRIESIIKEYRQLKTNNYGEKIDNFINAILKQAIISYEVATSSIRTKSKENIMTK